jgi:hypothetical protein
VLTASVALLAGPAAPSAWGVSPDDDDVQRAKERGVKYLLNAPEGTVPVPPDIELGANCLAAIALRKSDNAQRLFGL